MICSSTTPSEARGPWRSATLASARSRERWAPACRSRPARLNADAAADLVFYRATTGEWAEALNVGPGRFVVRASGTGVPDQQLLLADFTGEGLDDRLHV